MSNIVKFYSITFYREVHIKDTIVVEPVTTQMETSLTTLIFIN